MCSELPVAAVLGIVMQRRFQNVLTICFLVGGCSLGETGGVKPLPAVSSSYTTTADWRMVLQKPLPTRDNPNQIITCAEPSPDVAKIAAQTASGDFGASAKGMAKVQPEVALSFALARSESLAQLGKRLATVQLLRDALYRACEAYSNNAISSATYAMIVSRYDDVMVTLLLGELAAGEGGGALATLASAASNGAIPLAEATASLQEARTQAEGARAALAKAETELKAAEALKADVATRDADIKAARGRHEDAKSARTAKEQLFEDVVRKVAGGGTSASAGVSSAAAAQHGGAAVELAKMQAAYLQDFNLDAIMVGCLSTLSTLDAKPADGVETASAPARTVRGADRNLQDQCRSVLDDGATLRIIAYARALQVVGAGNQQGQSDAAAAVLQRLSEMSRNRTRP